jgi:LmbE family N-acetylglucosaminyl deacetylase
VPRTYVFFHAHPDDEALLTAGTMARLSAQGHRVVLVVATAGERGLADAQAGSSGGGLGTLRMTELQASARALGCARVEWLGYADSGLNLDGAAPAAPIPATGAEPEPFAAAEVDTAAQRLAELLHEEQADLLTSYDPAGGYGHPDHVQVHRVGLRAAQLAGTPRLMEATVDRDLLLRGLRLARLVYRFPPEFDVAAFEKAYTPRAQITHRVSVRRHAAAKRASMAAHVSQTGGGESERTLAALLRIPGPIFRWVLGTEWYVRRDAGAGKGAG